MWNLFASTNDPACLSPQFAISSHPHLLIARLILELCPFQFIRNCDFDSLAGFGNLSGVGTTTTNRQKELQLTLQTWFCLLYFASFFSRIHTTFYPLGKAIKHTSKFKNLTKNKTKTSFSTLKWPSNESVFFLCLQTQSDDLLEVIYGGLKCTDQLHLGEWRLPVVMLCHLACKIWIARFLILRNWHSPSWYIRGSNSKLQGGGIQQRKRAAGRNYALVLSWLLQQSRLAIKFQAQVQDDDETCGWDSREDERREMWRKFRKWDIF